MTDKKIITEHELNYIETLYLSCNIQDFVSMINFKESDLNYDITPYHAYIMMTDYVFDHIASTFKCNGEAKGRTWYESEDYSIGIMPFDRAKKANQYNCVIQYKQSYMFTLNKNLDGIKLPFGTDRSLYKIKRIDVTKIAKHTKDYTTNHGYISPFRREDNVNGTVYLGHRSNGVVLRLYNKTKELLDTENDKKIELLSKYFGDIENLWTYELEMSRSYLKENLGIDNLGDLDRVYAAYKNIVGKLRIYEDTDHNKKLLAQGNRKRIKAYTLTDFEEYERVEKKRYYPSWNYLIKKITDRANKYYDNMEIEKTPTEAIRLASAILEELGFGDKELAIWFEDSDSEVEKRQMTAKHERIRANQGNDLEIESRRYFGDKKALSPQSQEIQGTIPTFEPQQELKLTYT